MMKLMQGMIIMQTSHMRLLEFNVTGIADEAAVKSDVPDK